MPVYTVKNKETEEVVDVNCPYIELEEFLKENQEWIQLLKMPATIGGTVSTLRQAGQGWQDVLSKIKKGSGKENNVNV
jgi:hypothetical protein